MFGESLYISCLMGYSLCHKPLLWDGTGHWRVYVGRNWGLIGCMYESSCVIRTIYPVCTSARVLWSQPHSSCCTDAPRNRRLFFCERMTPSFAPDSCAGSLFALSWVVLIKLCCRSSERRLMDAQEVWQLWGCRTERASSHLFPLLYSSLNGEANQTTWIWAPQTDKCAHAYTPSARTA